MTDELPVVYLSRRNLLTLLSKLDRKKQGDMTACTILKNDDVHPTYPQSMPTIMVVGVEDDDYYKDRSPGAVHPKENEFLDKTRSK